MLEHSPAPDNNGVRQQRSHDYPSFLAENDAEVARLLVQQRHLTKHIGGLLPASLDLSAVHRVLDAACGVGGWVYDMARSYPAMQVIGMDKSEYFIRQARSMAWAKALPNASFVVQDVRHLPRDFFPAETFDLITLRFVAGHISREDLPTLLQTLIHICRQGCTIHWLEAELPVTNSPAYQQFAGMVLQALKVAGRAFSPGSSIGITAYMESGLRNAGCRSSIQSIVHAIEVSAGTAAHSIFARHAWAFGHQVRPFLLATGVTTAEECEAVLLRMQREIQADDFCGICFLRTVMGVKRRGDDPPEPIWWR
jgi:ubiquinone/menaquinone biosynthesis C-methylase UbiE